MPQALFDSVFVGPEEASARKSVIERRAAGLPINLHRVFSRDHPTAEVQSLVGIGMGWAVSPLVGILL